jgi:hypothetical protein
MAWPERLAPDTAILILHGGSSGGGGGGDALRMASALRRPKRSCRVKIYEGGGHDLIGDMADVRA